MARILVAPHAESMANFSTFGSYMALWLPYLLLSTRVNVTYRSRLPA